MGHHKGFLHQGLELVVVGLVLGGQEGQRPLGHVARPLVQHVETGHHGQREVLMTALLILHQQQEDLTWERGERGWNGQ